MIPSLEDVHFLDAFFFECIFGRRSCVSVFRTSVAIGIPLNSATWRMSVISLGVKRMLSCSLHFSSIVCLQVVGFNICYHSMFV